MNNPPIVLEAFTRPAAQAPLSLARLALLEQIGSPFLDAPREAALAEVLPSLYLQSLPLSEALAEGARADLAARALLWADTLTCADYQARAAALNAALEAFFSALPRPEADAEAAPKKASAATAGSSPSPSGQPEPTIGRSRKSSP